MWTGSAVDMPGSLCFAGSIDFIVSSIDCLLSMALVKANSPRRIGAISEICLLFVTRNALPWPPGKLCAQRNLGSEWQSASLNERPSVQPAVEHSSTSLPKVDFWEPLTCNVDGRARLSWLRLIQLLAPTPTPRYKQTVQMFDCEIIAYKVLSLVSRSKLLQTPFPYDPMPDVQSAP